MSRPTPGPPPGPPPGRAPPPPPGGASIPSPNQMPPYGMPPPGMPPPGYMQPPYMPPMPAPWDPSYAQWYSQWYYSQQPPVQTPVVNKPPPSCPPPPPSTDQPPPPGYECGPPPAKKASLMLSTPPPPPPPPDESPMVRPEWQAAKKGAVIYKNPRPPTPEPPKPVEPTPPVLPPPQLQEPPSPPVVVKPARMQWWYDGQSWVFANERPPTKPPTEEDFKLSYTQASAEDPVGLAVMANMRGKYVKPDKPKATPVRCDVCSLTVSCKVTYESHINGKPHKKRLAQVTKAHQLEEKQKADAERAKNLVPEVQGDDNTLESTTGGDIHCKVCDCNMNSSQQAQSHVAGSKHRHRMEKFMRGQQRGGRGGSGFGRGGFGGPSRGLSGWMAMGRGGGGRPESLMDLQVGMPGELDVTTDEAQEEYERVFAESLANNVDLEEAKQMAEAAKQAALGFGDGQDEVEYVSNDDDQQFPPPGVSVIKAPKGFTPGTYKCEPCQVVLNNEADLQEHLVTESHAVLTTSTGGAARGRGSGRGKGPKIYRGKPNTENYGTMKAQRGRRGLISNGEVMPEKLTKGQKKAQPKDLAEVIEEAKAKAKLLAAASNKHTPPKTKFPLLMNFVKGGVIEGDGKSS